MEEYQDIFSYFDRWVTQFCQCDLMMMIARDGGGSISSVELGQVMRTFGWAPSEMELQELISEIDQDGNGSISFNEFVWLMTKYVICQIPFHSRS